LFRLSPASSPAFYQIVREERLFCAVLAHLLMQGTRNISAFFELVNRSLPAESRLLPSDLAEAQVYVEFTFLRDSWDSLGRDNIAKRMAIFDLLGRVDGLKHLRSEDFPDSIPEFNEAFVGPSGRRITNDIVYPGRWTVGALADRFGNQPDKLRDLCRFKWSFNIKPDIVILAPEVKAICVEAKLTSGEGFYPTSYRDCQVFDSIFGRGQGRVRQVELQQFMFETLLRTPCQIVTLGLTTGLEDGSVALTWRDVFGSLDLSRSLPYVRRLTQQNRHLTSPVVLGAGEPPATPVRSDVDET
jgi:hypothetical protein